MAGNLLKGEASPYLRQHAGDPVDWHPWGEEAFDEARERDVPVFLSVGYSACHWCHVMRRESFSDDEVAELLNENFVPVKVDREERPDVDAVYMESVQAMTGRGGWPLTAFLTPDGEPFYGGTYFPPEERGGMPGLKDVLRSIADAWETEREALVEDAEQVADALGGVEGQGEMSEEAMEEAFGNLRGRYDGEFAGFGAGPKFPMSPVLSLLLRLRGRFDGAPEMLRETLVAMQRGGVYDQVGGGFHRYAVDREWRVPHFEKMLYDNAQLLGIYARAHRATGRPGFCRVVDETADYLLREMRSPEGGFYAAQDADTEGEEGRFYTWTRDEVAEVLGGEEAELLCRYFGVTEEGDLDGRSVPTREASLEGAAEAVGMGPEEAEATLRRGREALFEARERRTRPARDEKVIAAWNGLAIKGFAEAGAAGRTRFLDAAEEAAEFLRGELVDGDAVARYWKDGEARGDGFLEDHALLGKGFLALYLVTGEPEWFRAARSRADAALDRFYDPDDGAFYDAEEPGDLVARPRATNDTAAPSGGAAAATLLLDLHALSGEERYREAAEAAAGAVAELARTAPTFHGEWLAAMDRVLHPPVTVAVAGDPEGPGTGDLLDAARGRPGVLTALTVPGAEESVPLLRDREPIEGEATAYVCRESVCIRPVTEPGELRDLLESQG